MSSENIKTNIPAQPVKNIEDMINWRTHVQNNYPLKQYMFFALSLDTGIAPGKLLHLTWNRIQTLLGPGVPKDKRKLFIQIPSDVFEENSIVEVPPEDVEGLLQLRNNNPADVYVFQSESGRAAKSQPWTRQYVTKFLKDSAKEAGIAEKIGFLSLHKTFGYQLVVRGKFTLVEIQSIFEQHSLAATRKYLNITDEKIQIR